MTTWGEMLGGSAERGRSCSVPAVGAHGPRRGLRICHTYVDLALSIVPLRLDDSFVLYTWCVPGYQVPGIPYEAQQVVVPLASVSSSDG